MKKNILRRLHLLAPVLLCACVHNPLFAAGEVFVTGDNNDDLFITSDITSAGDAVVVNGSNSGFINFSRFDSGTADIVVTGGDNGLEIAGQNTGAVQLEEGSSIVSTNDAIVIGGNNTGVILNYGSITSTAGNGIHVAGSVTGTPTIEGDVDYAIVENDGVILASGAGIQIDTNVGDSDTFTSAVYNSGRIGSEITAVTTGISVLGHNYGTISNDGTIYAQEDGIYVTYGSNLILNKGIIHSDGNGIHLNFGSTDGFQTGKISSTGIITAADVGIMVGFSFKKDDVLYYAGGYVDEVELGGSITAGGSGVGLYGPVGTLNSSATIISDTGYGIFIGGGVSNDFESLGDITAYKDGIIINSLCEGDFTNTGDIHSETGIGIIIGDYITGDFTNSGNVFSEDTAIYLSKLGDHITGGDFYNSGELTANTDGIIALGSFCNFTSTGNITVGDGDPNTNERIISVDHVKSATISGNLYSECDGVSFWSIEEDFISDANITVLDGNGINIGVNEWGGVGGSFSQTGDITSSYSNIQFEGKVGDFFASGNFVCSADSITGNILFRDDVASILLDGTIVGMHEGVDAWGSVTGNFKNNADITSTLSSAIRVEKSIAGDFVNTGNITANGAFGAIKVYGSVRSLDLSGEIISKYDGVNVGSVSGNISNTGTITSSAGYGIHVDGDVGGSITNTGSITSYDEAIYIGGNVIGSVDSSGDLTIQNDSAYAIYIGGNVSSISIEGNVSCAGDAFYVGGEIGSLDFRGNVYGENNGITVNDNVSGNLSYTGNMTAGNIGIYVGGNNNGQILLTHTSSINSQNTGIYLGGENTNEINITGWITSESADGVYLEKGGSGSVCISAPGSLTVFKTGIYVNGSIGLVDVAGSVTAGENALYVAGDILGDLSSSGVVSAEDDAFYIKGSVENITLSADINAGDCGLYVGADVSGDLTNTGSIHASLEGIHVIGSVSDVSNTGTVVSTTSNAIEIGGNAASIDLSGTIKGNQYGVLIAGDVTGDLTFAGEVIASNDAIHVAGSVGKITLSDNISAGDYGVYIGSNCVSIDNSAVILSGNGIYVNGSVVGDFINSGHIASTLEGVYVAGSVGAFENTGTVVSSGNSVDAIHIVGDADSLYLDGGIKGSKNGVCIEGSVLGDVANKATITAEDGHGIYVGGSVSGDITNTGSITSTAEAIYVVGNTGNIISTGDITVTNEDTVGIYIGGDVQSIRMSGNINTTGDAFYVGGSISDYYYSGDITSDGNGVEIDGDVDGGMYFEGNLTSSENGIVLNGSNNGTIGVTAGSVVTSTGTSILVKGDNTSMESIDNAGIISSTDGNGIEIDGNNTGAIRNLTSGTINAGGYGIYVVGNNETDAVIDNAGPIISGNDGIRIDGNNAGNITSNGILSSSSDGIVINGQNSGSIVNSGHINAKLGIAIVNNTTGTILNSGTITGNMGIMATGTGTIENTGTIETVTGIATNMDVVNSGTIDEAHTGIFSTGSSVINTGTIGTSALGSTAVSIALAGDSQTAVVGGTILSTDNAIYSAGNNNVYLMGADETHSQVYVGGNMIADMENSDSFLYFGSTFDALGTANNGFDFTYHDTVLGFHGVFMGGTTTLANDSEDIINTFGASVINSGARLVVSDHSAFVGSGVNHYSEFNLNTTVSDGVQLVNSGELSGYGIISVRSTPTALGTLYSNGSINLSGDEIAGVLAIDGNIILDGTVNLDVYESDNDSLFVVSPLDESAVLRIASGAEFNLEVADLDQIGSVVTIANVQNGQISIEDPINKYQLVKVNTNLTGYQFYALKGDSDDGESLYAILARDGTYENIAETSNEQSVAKYLYEHSNEALDITFALNTTASDSSVRSQLRLMTAEVYPSILNVERNTIQSLNNSTSELFRPYSAKADESSGWYSFAQAMVSQSDYSDDSVSDFDADTNLYVVGVGHKSASFDFGGWIAAGEEDISTSNNSIDSDVTSGALYARYNNAGDYYYASVLYSTSDYDARRTASQALNTDFIQLDAAVSSADFEGSTFSAYFEKGYTFELGQSFLQPYASFQYSQMGVDSFTETGGNFYNLSADFEDMNSALLGLGVNWIFQLSDSFSLQIGANAFYELSDTNGLMNASYEGVSDHFSIIGCDEAELSYRGSLGFNWNATDRWLMHLGLNGTSSDCTESLSGNVGVTFFW